MFVIPSFNNYSNYLEQIISKNFESSNNNFQMLKKNFFVQVA